MITFIILNNRRKSNLTTQTIGTNLSDKMTLVHGTTSTVTLATTC